MDNSLIKRQDAIDYLMINTNWCDEDGYRVEDADERRKITTYLMNGVPSAQPEIVRCKDCIHKKRYMFPPKYEEDDYCVVNERIVNAENYCSWGEKREMDGGDDDADGA